MNSERSICSPAPEAGCSQTSFSATGPLPRSSGTRTVAPYSVSAPPTGGSPACTCTRETCGCSIHPATPAEWIASQRASLARISASPVVGPALRASAADCGPRSDSALAFCDLASSGWRTAQPSLLGASESCCETFPAWGMTRAGACYPLPPRVPRTYVLDGSAWLGAPTPTANSYGSCQGGAAGREGQRNRPSLQTMARKGLLPTPTASLGDGRGIPSHSVAQERYSSGRRNLDDAVSLWPTPISSDARGSSGRPGPGKQVQLVDAVRFGTPLARDWKSGKASAETKAGNSRPLSEQVGGQLNPTWVEWLMGWPLGWTGCAPSETGRSRSRSRSRGECSEGRSDG